MARHRVGLVLGAGGSVGIAFHNGVVSALRTATGWDPASAEVIVGTSAGAIAAACVAAGVPPEEPPYEQRLPDRPLPATYARRAVLNTLRRPWTLRPIALGSALLAPGRLSTQYIVEGMDRLTGGEWPRVRPWVCAVRLSDGARVVFGGPGAPPAGLGEAVAASCAVPRRFRPVAIAGDAYADGGVHSIHNLDLVNSLGLELVVVSAPSAASCRWRVSSPRDAFREFCRRQLLREARAFERAGTPVVVIAPDHAMVEVMRVRPLDSARREVLAGAARELALSRIAEGATRVPGGDWRLLLST